MKSTSMRPPAVSDIYNQKMSYENHKRKLNQIREDRRHQLADSGRMSQIQQIRDSKSKSFAHRFNEQSAQISKSNVRLLVKLEQARPFTRYSTQSATERSFRDPSASFIKPTQKRKIVETEKQNSRLYFRMKAVPPTLSRERLQSDYARAQKIRDRIAKYATQNNKVSLKSEQFAQNRSATSHRSLNASTASVKKGLVSHYNREDIVRNRIQTDKQVLKSRKRPLPALATKELGDEVPPQPQHKEEERNTFFATEPIKNKRSQPYPRKFK